MFSAVRRDVRIPIEVGVQLTDKGMRARIESTFTQDISARGAKVLSARRWRKNQRLTLTALAGGFQCVARVAYCRPEPGTGYAVGLELVKTTGKWIVSHIEANGAVHHAA
jgi:hypothetical protein